MYLYNYECDYDSRTKETIDSVLSKYNIEATKFSRNANINSYLVLDNGTFIAEFPGNCAALVIHNIQTKSDKVNVIKATLDLAKTMEYALVFASGTESYFKRCLEDLGFKECIVDVFNPHSENVNFFMVYDFDDEEESA